MAITDRGDLMNDSEKIDECLREIEIASDKLRSLRESLPESVPHGFTINLLVIINILDHLKLNLEGSFEEVDER